MPAIDYAALRSDVSIRQILDLMAYQPLTRRGDQWRGPCPLLDDSAGSRRGRHFTVHLRRHLYYCHRCRAGGNQLDLWAAFTQLSLHDAAIDLCRKLHLDIRRYSLIRNPEPAPDHSTPPATPGTH